jgi:hypothetical protein
VHFLFSPQVFVYKDGVVELRAQKPEWFQYLSKKLVPDQTRLL